MKSKQTSGNFLTDASAGETQGYHVPVLLQEALAALNIQPDGIYADCTFGGGGHSRAILQQLGEKGRLLAFDQDADAAANIPADERLLFVPQNFRHLQRFWRLNKLPLLDGLLADLGVSSHQFDEAERGFSTRFDALLDMRMDQRQSLTAAEVLKTFSEQQLHKMFEQYGEVTNARTLARTITALRATRQLTTINEFKLALQPVVKGNPAKYFAQVFQALRIQVNDELGALEEMLCQLTAVLKPGGHVVIITFHSLEDRIVKNFFRNGGIDEKEVDEVYGTKQESPFSILTKKPVTAGEQELKENPRSRSARLRAAMVK